MALIIAGERSGVGKTTVTLSLLSVLNRRQQSVQSFKVGPDYIDPMFHRHISQRPCRNLDPVLTSEAYVQTCFRHHTHGVDSALIEGVMGLFDGASGENDFASTAHIARLLNLPVLLVLDCSRLSRSVAAIAHGYKTFDPRITLAGVILNRVGSDRHLDLLTTALDSLQIPILGVLRRQDNITIPDRHLGLVPTAELPALDALFARLADLGEKNFDWTQLTPLLKVEQQKSERVEEWGSGGVKEWRSRGEWNQRGSSEFKIQNSKLKTQNSFRIAVAYDRAFNFYYADNLDLLEALGAELVFWSPISDCALPDNVQGLYLGGGFPEVFAAELAHNQAAKHSVRSALELGLPTYAECGGLMYLCEKIVDFEGRSWDMVGVLPTNAHMDARLTLGYRRAIALQDNLLAPAKTSIWGHEFHRSRLSHSPNYPLYQAQGYNPQSVAVEEGWQLPQLPNLYASYIHLHWGSRPELPQRFLSYCAQFRTSRA